VLALTIAAFLLDGGESAASAVGEFFSELAISTGLGIVLGILLALVVSERRFGIWREFPAIVVGLAVAAGYASIDAAGGSGYLGAAIAGVIAGNTELLGLRVSKPARDEIDQFARLTTGLVVLLVFVVVGANLPLGTMADNLLAALAVLAVLLFVARPLTVLACLLPDRRGRWTRNELIFIGWTRETGVVPAAVAGLLIAMGVPNEDQMVTVLALAILVTLALQATTKAALAKRLGLLESDQVNHT
jgi:cell volume regulation protein A